MTDHEIRTIIVEALEYASVFTMKKNDLTAAFLKEKDDIRLSALDMDSLASMELCIAIELNTGVSVVPTDLQRIGTLNRLVETIRTGIKE